MNILITAKSIPDVDGVACAIGYAEYLSQIDPQNSYTAAFDKDVHIEAKFVCDNLGISLNIISDASNFDLFILVDMSESFGLPKGIRCKDVIDIVDHRMFPSYETYPNASFRIEPVGAAATQIAEFYNKPPAGVDKNVQLSQNTACLLLCAIYSNTVSFKADVTTFRDLRAKDFLLSVMDQKQTGLPQLTYEFKSQYVLDNLTEVLLSDFKSGGTKFGLDEPVNIFQIETNKSEKLLESIGQLLKAMSEVAKDQKYHLLLIQDAGKGKTFLVSNSEKVKDRLFQTNLNCSSYKEQVLILPKIVMRKGVLMAINQLQ